MCVSVYFFLLDHVLFRFELMMMMMVSPVGDFKHLNTFRSDFKSRYMPGYMAEYPVCSLCVYMREMCNIKFRETIRHLLHRYIYMDTSSHKLVNIHLTKNRGKFKTKRPFEKSAGSVDDGP